MSNCRTIRHFLRRSGTLNLATGETKMTGSEWVTDHCNVPLFGNDKHTCKGCRDGWQVEGNRPATFEEAKATRDMLDAKAKELGAALKAISGGGVMNLTPDHVKASPEWKSAFSDHRKAFDSLREFNAQFVKQFAAELKAERKGRGNAGDANASAALKISNNL